VLRSLGAAKSVPLVKYLLPTYLALLRSGDLPFRELLFGELVNLVSIVKADIAPWLDPLVDRITHHLARDYWAQPLFGTVLTLVEELAIALRHDFTICLPVLVPRLLGVLHGAETTGALSKALHALEVFSYTCNLEDYLTLVVQALVSLLD